MQALHKIDHVGGMLNRTVSIQFVMVYSLPIVMIVDIILHLFDPRVEPKTCYFVCSLV